jgi:uncharacterized protein YndB with AHSA1/START domain
MTAATAYYRMVAEPGIPSVTIEREVAAPRDVVFRCFTEPDLLVQWLGPRKYGMRVDHMDVRHGGSWSFVNIDPETGAEFAFRGVYHGEPTPDQFVQTFEYLGAPGHISMDTLNLVDRGDGRTLIRTTSLFQSVEARDAMIEHGMEDGVKEGYERLDELVERIGATGRGEG